MSERMSKEQRLAWWAQRARDHERSPTASWSDRDMIALEINTVLKWLDDGDNVLDIGCCNGYSTCIYAIPRPITVKGIDIVPELIEQANANLEWNKDRMFGDVAFEVGDATSLKEEDGLFDKVVSVRTLMCLDDQDEQERALKECRRVLRPNGLLIMLEATVQGLRNLNRFRQEWGLEDIEVPPMNTYLDEDRLKGLFGPGFELCLEDSFASTYFVGTRVVLPIMERARGGTGEGRGPDNEWLEWFHRLNPAGDYAPNKLFVIQKHE